MVVEGSHKSLLFKIHGDSTFKKSSYPRTSRTEWNNHVYLPKTEQNHPLFEKRAPNQSHDIQEKLAFSTFSQANLEQGAWKSDKMSDSEKISVALENFCKHLWVFLSSYRSTFLPIKSCSGSTQCSLSLPGQCLGNIPISSRKWWNSTSENTPRAGESTHLQRFWANQCHCAGSWTPTDWFPVSCQDRGASVPGHIQYNVSVPRIRVILGVDLLAPLTNTD